MKCLAKYILYFPAQVSLTDGTFIVLQAIITERVSAPDLKERISRLAVHTEEDGAQFIANRDQLFVSSHRRRRRRRRGYL